MGRLKIQLQLVLHSSSAYNKTIVMKTIIP